MNIAIIGANSYIGDNLSHFLLQKGHKVSIFDIKNKCLDELNLNGIDSIVIVAAIVHNKNNNDKELYFRINSDLPFKVSKYAKENGVKQVVFLSSMSIYGVKKELNGSYINKDTPVCPKNLYGITKLDAEKRILTLEDKNFKVAIVRPANVYGKGCRGNYLHGFIKLSKLFNTNPNMNSNAIHGLIYIDNLSNALNSIISENLKGIYHLQDIDSPTANNFISYINEARSIHKKESNFLWNLIPIFKKTYRKIFGGVAYDKSLLDFSSKTQIISTNEGIKRSVML